jgi:hypothetical protein
LKRLQTAKQTISHSVVLLAQIYLMMMRCCDWCSVPEIKTLLLQGRYQIISAILIITWSSTFLQ